MLSFNEVNNFNIPLIKVINYKFILSFCHSNSKPFFVISSTKKTIILISFYQKNNNEQNKFIYSYSNYKNKNINKVKQNIN